MTSQGQVGKRLQIIKIAISITDEGTINLQRLQLKKYKNNKQLENILTVLDDGNFAQATKLIDRYLHNPSDEPKKVKPKTDTKNLVDKEEEELIKKFGLFTEAGRRANSSQTDDTRRSTDDSYDEDIYIDESEILYSDESEDPKPKSTTEDILSQFDSIQKDQLPEKKIPTDDEVDIEDTQDIPLDVPLDKEEEIDNTKDSTTDIDSIDLEIKEESSTQVDIDYPAISYIDQKVKNMFNQYPQVVESAEKFESEEDLLYNISLNGYTERDIEKTIERVYLLADDGKLDEASHLLLIAAATESIYAQFILARELYKGNILQRDLTESFTQINQLAQDNYPEAVCDLAQFYEYGIGITKDKKKAFRLYEDALDLGVKRADAHLSRMEEESKGILARLFNKR